MGWISGVYDLKVKRNFGKRLAIFIGYSEITGVWQEVSMLLDSPQRSPQQEEFKGL